MVEVINFDNTTTISDIFARLRKTGHADLNLGITIISLPNYDISITKLSAHSSKSSTGIKESLWLDLGPEFLFEFSSESWPNDKAN